MARPIKNQKLGLRSKAELDAQQRKLSVLPGRQSGDGNPLPRSPKTLGAAGKGAWRATLKSCPWLIGDEAALEVLTDLAHLADERDELRGLIAKHGRTAVGGSGQIIDSPHVTQLRSVERSIGQLRTALGVGPASRLRIGGTISPPKSGKAADEDERVRRLRERLSNA